MTRRRYFLRPGRAYSRTLAAVYAFIFVKCKLGLKAYTLRVVTPKAFQRTTFKEYRCAYSVAVMRGKALYTKIKPFSI